MGTTFNVYCGPYLRCLLHDGHLSSSAEIPGIAVDTFNNVSSDAGIGGTEHWLTPNGRREGGPNRTLDFIPREESGITFDEVDCAAEKAWLALAYAPEIEALRAVYDSVTVEWGCVCYTS